MVAGPVRPSSRTSTPVVRLASSSSFPSRSGAALKPSVVLRVAAANHDPDPDSDGTTIVVNQP